MNDGRKGSEQDEMTFLCFRLNSRGCMIPGDAWPRIPTKKGWLSRNTCEQINSRGGTNFFYFRFETVEPAPLNVLLLRLIGSEG